MMFSGVLSSHIDLIWSQAKPFIERALPFSVGKFNIDYIYHALKDARMQLWVVLDPDVVAAGVTEVQNYPQKRVCSVMFAGGDGQDWPRLMLTIEEFARYSGCNSVEIWGRKGWERVLTDYSHLHTVIGKEL